jgi:ElaB/YqjD/DUF883 family membrane-anchored ribosome-binding protein
MGEGTKDVRREVDRSSASDETTPDTGDIRAQIERKRADISGTLDEIQDRLAPRNLMSQATGTVRDATASRIRQVKGAASDAASSTRRAATKTAEQAREHPWSAAAAVAGVGAAAWWLARRPSSGIEEDWELDDYSEESLYFDEDLTFADGNGSGATALKTGALPVVLTGLAVGWWMWSRRSGARDTLESAAQVDYDTSWNEGAYGSAGADAGSYRTFEGDRRWRDETSSATGRVRGALSGAASRVRSAATTAGERTREVAGQAQRQISDRSHQAVSQLERWVDRNPLAAGATALLAGVVIGIAIPESNRERRLMAGARRRLIDSAQKAGRDAVGRAKQTLVEATNQRRRA